MSSSEEYVMLTCEFTALTFCRTPKEKKMNGKKQLGRRAKRKEKKEREKER